MSSNILDDIRKYIKQSKDGKVSITYHPSTNSATFGYATNSDYKTTDSDGNSRYYNQGLDEINIIGTNYGIDDINRYNTLRNNVVYYDDGNEKSITEDTRSMDQLEDLYSNLRYQDAYNYLKDEGFYVNDMTPEQIMETANARKSGISTAQVGPAPKLTDWQQQKRQLASQLLADKYQKLNETEQAVDIISNPYNPIGWIPFVRTLSLIGADQQYQNLTGQSSPYKLDAALSGAFDAIGWQAPFSTYAKGYLGSLIGGQIGKNYGYEGLGQLMGGFAGGLTPNLSNRFSSNGIRIGNNYWGLRYTPQGTMSTGGLGELSGIKINKTPVWQLKALPGYHIKSTLTGSPLEKQLSKNGTLSLKQLQAYVNKNDVPAIDKELLNRVLQNHTGETHIDYNTLRQEVQDMIPKYNRVSQSQYADYGMNRLGIQVGRNNQEFLQHHPEFPWRVGDDGSFYITSGPNEGMAVPNPSLFSVYTKFPSTKAQTFTFESPGFNGSEKHYEGNPMGHSRTYTTAEEPDVLHVMESQSDWAQNPKEFHERRNRINEIVNNFKNARLNQNTLGYSEDRFNELYTKALDDLFNSNIQSRMIDTYPIRQIQENLQYAAQQGQHKMRYPTPETAAKIEGYQKIKNNNTGVDFEIYDIEQEIQKLNQQQSQLFQEELNKIGFESSFREAIEMASNKVVNNSIQQRINQLRNQIKELKQSKYQFSPEHQTILKKYTDFPKQFQKLFGKKAEVRTVTDSKGNTWYEVDVPQSYIDGTAEMLFKKGGRLVKKHKTFTNKINELVKRK